MTNSLFPDNVTLLSIFKDNNLQTKFYDKEIEKITWSIIKNIDSDKFENYVVKQFEKLFTSHGNKDFGCEFCGNIKGYSIENNENAKTIYNFKFNQISLLLMDFYYENERFHRFSLEKYKIIRTYNRNIYQENNKNWFFDLDSTFKIKPNVEKADHWCEAFEHRKPLEALVENFLKHVIFKKLLNKFIYDLSFEMQFFENEYQVNETIKKLEYNCYSKRFIWKLRELDKIDNLVKKLNEFIKIADEEVKTISVKGSFKYSIGRCTQLVSF